MSRKSDESEPSSRLTPDEPLCAALSLGDIGVFRWELATDELALSERARSILGVPGGTPTAQHLIEVAVHPDDRKRARALRDRSRSAAERVPAFECQLADNGGRTRWVALTMAPAYEGTRATAMVGSVMDVTDRHEWTRERDVYLRAFEALADETDPARTLVAIAEGGELPAAFEQVVRTAAARMGDGGLPGHSAGGSPLTARETEVLQMASHGGSSAAIATRLLVSTSTVKTHFEHIYAKLGVSERAGAVAEGLRRGLIS